MGVLSEIFGGMGGEILKSLDGVFTSDEERLNANNKLQEILEKGKKEVLDAAHKKDQERTKRHVADMQSDSWLSKNVRPSSLIYLLAVVSTLAITDGNMQLGDAATFTVGKEYIELFKDLLLLAFGFYFGSRGVEKVAEKVKEIVVAKKEKQKKKVDDVWEEDDTDW